MKLHICEHEVGGQYGGAHQECLAAGANGYASQASNLDGAVEGEAGCRCTGPPSSAGFCLRRHLNHHVDEHSEPQVPGQRRASS